MTLTGRVSLLAVAALLSALLCGCSAGDPYVLHGRVIPGPLSTIDFVNSQDGRLYGEQGIAGAEIRVYRDPLKPNRSMSARNVSDQSGSFTIVLDQFGAGWMVEQWEIDAVCGGHVTAEQIVTLPEQEANLYLLILLAPGESTPPTNDRDPMRDFERFR